MCPKIPAPSLQLLFWEHLFLHIYFLQKNMYWCSGKLIMNNFFVGKNIYCFHSITCSYATAHSVRAGLVCRWAQTFHNTDILGLLYSYGYCYPVCNSINFLELLREMDAQLLFQSHIFTFQALVTRLT